MKKNDQQDVDAHVGKRLRARRTILGLSQSEVAKEVGITFQQVQKYEKGSNAMNARRLVEFAKFLKVPVSYFFDGLDASPSSMEIAAGFAERDAEKFGHKTVSDRESLEIMKAFKRIKEQSVRKRLADMVRAIADSKPILE